MNIKQLKEHLNKFDEDLEIIIPIDPEGNGFNKLSGDFSEMLADLSKNYIDDIYMTELPKDGIKNGYTEEDLGDPDTMSKCLVLWP